MTSSAVISGLSISKQSLSISWPAASRFPSTRSAMSCAASTVICLLYFCMRCRIHSGKQSASIGQTCIVTPTLFSDLYHLLCLTFLSSLSLVISKILSLASCSAYSVKTLPPSRPGLLDPMRNSMSRVLANNDMLALSSINLFQSKPVATSSTTRSSTPCSRALSLMRSAASFSCSGSSPLIR